MKANVRILAGLVLGLLLVGCGSEPAPAETVPATAVSAEAVGAVATATPTTAATATAVPLPTATATATVMPSATATATPLPGIQVLVLNGGMGTAVSGAEVVLLAADGSEAATATANNQGVVLLGELAAGTYTLVVSAPDFVETSRSLTVTEGMVETAVILPPVATPTPLPTATFTPAPTSAAVNNAPIVSAAPPSGQNLLINPGFEEGKGGYAWEVRLIPAVDFPQFVHSGSYSAETSLVLNSSSMAQRVMVSPGLAYRAGAWVKLWSSSGYDRTISENPGDIYARICLNVFGDPSPEKAGTFCSGPVRPIDTWQFIAVDAVAESDTLAVILQAYMAGPNRPLFNIGYWDDIVLGISPVVPTPTPAPLGPPVVPAPVPFNAIALRDSMVNAHSMITQLGGLLDRLAAGSRETCGEYMTYYRGIVQSARYDGIPAEWQGLYNEYIFALENTASRNDGIYGLCESGGGVVNAQAYGNARQSVNESIDRLSPAIDGANALVGP